MPVVTAVNADGTNTYQQVVVNFADASDTPEFQAGVDIQFDSGGKPVFQLSGLLGVRQLPGGVADITVKGLASPESGTACPTGTSGASIKIYSGDTTPAFAFCGIANFRVGGTEGFRLQDFRINSVAIFGQNLNLANAAAGLAQPAADRGSRLATNHGGCRAAATSGSSTSSSTTSTATAWTRRASTATSSGSARRHEAWPGPFARTGQALRHDLPVHAHRARSRPTATTPSSSAPARGEDKRTRHPEPERGREGDVHARHGRRVGRRRPHRRPRGPARQSGGGVVLDPKALSARGYIDVSFTSRSGDEIDRRPSTATSSPFPAAACADAQLKTIGAAPPLQEHVPLPDRRQGSQEHARMRSGPGELTVTFAANTFFAGTGGKAVGNAAQTVVFKLDAAQAATASRRRRNRDRAALARESLSQHPGLRLRRRQARPDRRAQPRERLAQLRPDRQPARRTPTDEQRHHGEPDRRPRHVRSRRRPPGQLLRLVHRGSSASSLTS